MKSKKEVAAVSAVLAYIKEEEDAVSAIATQREYHSQRALLKGVQLQMNIWGVAGRQAQMQLHSLMLAKAFHGMRT
jgi:hypothetical protein